MASFLLVKSCISFVPLKDGTFAGDERYCDLSFQCKQTGMISKYVKIVMPNGEEVYEFLCTGDKVKSKEDLELDKAV
jgi:hypothetical protein